MSKTVARRPENPSRDAQSLYRRVVAGKNIGLTPTAPFCRPHSTARAAGLGYFEAMVSFL
uniref:Uncharacterized protein n=1 Tax=Pseudomonas aeruginosa TaxID=287 RepID=A0A6C0L3Z3_PSEAI|nr:hypothetical protein [Pseudomonas aeruginosa]